MLPSLAVPTLQLNRLSPPVTTANERERVSSRSERGSSCSERFERATSSRSLPSSRRQESLGVRQSPQKPLSSQRLDCYMENASETSQELSLDTLARQPAAWVNVRLGGPADAECTGDQSDLTFDALELLHKGAGVHNDVGSQASSTSDDELTRAIQDAFSETASSCDEKLPAEDAASFRPDYSTSSCSSSSYASEAGSIADEELPVPATDVNEGLALNLSELALKEVEVEGEDKRKKLAYFDQHMSEVYPGVFVVGEELAKDKKALDAAGITHVVNCIGMLMGPQFPDAYKYLTLHILDHSSEDIASLLYLVFNFIQMALYKGGKVCIHCSQGVSRSASLAIAYIMWKESKDYQQVFKALKEIRGVANPNLGFAAQLMRWEKLQAGKQSKIRAFEIAPHTATSEAPLQLVAREIREPITMQTFQPGKVLLVRTEENCYVWKGPHSRLSHQLAARRTHFDMVKYEGAPSELQPITKLDSLPADIEDALTQVEGL